MNDKIYDSIKYACNFALPALGVFYASMADIWNLPFANEVTRTVAAVVALMASLLGMSSAQHAATNKTRGGKQ